MIFFQVNNAGATLTGGLAATSLEGFDKMYNTNVRSVVMVTKKAMPKIIENKGKGKPIYCFEINYI